MYVRKLFLLLFLIGPWLQGVDGQTSKYWSVNFASEPFLLAGTVVGTGAGNQSAYYNPALISEITSDNVSISGDVVTLDFYNIQNAYGLNLDQKFSQFNVLPTFISFLLKSRKNKDLSFELAILSRDQMDIDIVASTTGEFDVYPSLSDEERFSAMNEIVARYYDTWIGAGSAYKVSDKFSVGVSSFISIKSLFDKKTKSINVYPASDTVYYGTTPVPFFNSQVSTIDRLNMFDIRLLFKVGLQYKIPRWRFGLNITMPSIQIAGSGNRYREISASSIFDEESGNFQSDFIIVDSQDNLPATFKDPLSVAFGINYGKDQDKTMLGFSIEYFKEIPVYKMVSAETHPGITSPEIYANMRNQDFLSIYYGATDILNVAIGYRKYINPRLTFLGGFRTDFDYLKGVDFSGTSNENNEFISFYWDSFHLSAGARFGISRHRFILGAEYTVARENGFRQLADFVPEAKNAAGDDLPLEDLDEIPVSFKFNGLALFIAFIFNFED